MVQNIFRYQYDSLTGAYLELVPAARSSLPYFRIYDQRHSSGGTMPVLVPPERYGTLLSSVLNAGSGDLLNQFLSIQNSERNPGTLGPTGTGAFIRVELVEHLGSAAARLVLDYPKAITHSLFNSVAEDRTYGQLGTASPETNNAFGPDDHDVLIRIATTIKIGSLQIASLQDRGVDVSRMIPVGFSDVNLYDVLDVPDAFFQIRTGISSANAYMQLQLFHEIFHLAFSERNYGGKFAGGHVEAFLPFLSGPSSTPFQLTTAMLQNDRVEKAVFDVGRARGLILGDQASADLYWQVRTEGHLQAIRAANGGRLPADFGEFKLLLMSGALEPQDRSPAIVLDSLTGEPIVLGGGRDDWIDVGPIDWGTVALSASSALGSTLGRRLFGEDRLGGALGGAVLGTLSTQVAAEILNAAGSTTPSVELIAQRSFRALGIDVASAGAGAVTSYLIGEIFAEMGVNGFAGEALSATTSFALSRVAENLTKMALGSQGVQWNSGLIGDAGLDNFYSFAGSFLGSKLASFVTTFDTVGGQIGFSVGGAVGAAALTSIFAKSTAIIANFLAPGVGAFVGSLIGGLVGTVVFGGTPESGAHVVWDAASGEFKIGRTWADDWGSASGNEAARERAIDVATVAGDVLNRLVEGFGDSASAYQNPHIVGAGAYGQESSKWLYWGNGENSQNHPLTGRYTDPMDAVNHGLRVALDRVTLQGGDVYLKRAFYKSLEANQSSSEYDFSALIGDLSVAADLSFYQDKRNLIDGVIALAPDSAVAQGWVLTLLRAAELNIDQYYKSDFYGGVHGFLDGSGFLRRTGLDLADVRLSLSSTGDLVIGDGSSLPSGEARVAGWWQTWSAETRWAAVAGPDGRTITAMETGQFDSSAPGGGELGTTSFAIDSTKTYEFSIYVRKEDLTKHYSYFGLNPGTVVDAVSGASHTYPYFWQAYPGHNGVSDSNKWYKVVGYVLPEGQRLASQSLRGGVYDTVTGQKVASVDNFAWDPARATSLTQMRFFNFNHEDQHGYSTLWYQPEVRVVEGGRAGANLLDLSGWPAPPRNTIVLPDFADLMGYTAPAYVSSSYTGTVYSDVVIATGTDNVSISDAANASVANGPGVTGLSRLSDDIFIGNAGHNQIWGHAGWDWLEGGAGVDELWGGEGDDFLSGGDGHDYVQWWINGPAAGGLYGGDGNDTLVGGAGHDTLFGENGNDTFFVENDGWFDIYNGGAGIDTMNFKQFTMGVHIDMNVGKVDGRTSELYGDWWYEVENVTGSNFNDTIIGDYQDNVLDGGLGADLIYAGGGNDRLIGGDGGDYLDGHTGVDIASYRDSRSGVTVSLLTGRASGGAAAGDAFFDLESLEGSEHADVLQGGSAAGELLGLDGNDVLQASPGATAYDGGEGIDTVDFSQSIGRVDVFLGAGVGYSNWAQGDTFKSIEQVIGSNLDDLIYGTDGSERLQGGGGWDHLYGGGGDDSYAFSVGGGIESVTDSGGSFDYIVVDRTISLDSLMLRRDGSTLILERQGAEEKVFVNSHFATTANVVEQLRWNNGSYIWLPTTANFTNGGWGNDTHEATAGADLHHGHQGDDNLYGGDGFDILIGGSGNDRLEGGRHGDTYVIGRGSGVDTIYDTHGYDTLVMADDLSADELMMGYVGADLYIGIRVTGDSSVTAFNAPDRIIIKDQKLAGNAVEVIQFAGNKISLPKVAGGATNSNTAPELTSFEYQVNARFYGGVISHIGAYDAEGDTLTYRVVGVDNTTYPSGSFYFLNGTSELYTTANWTVQDLSVTNVTVEVSDGTNISTGQIRINWRPDPNGGPLLPIVLDLDGDGLELINPSSSKVRTDVNEDGHLDQIGWVGADDAILAFDRNGSKTVDDLSEITFINDKQGATTDLEGLRGFDFDVSGAADGVLNARDVFFKYFLVWKDINQNGISEEGELLSLEAAGITSLNLVGVPTGEEVKKATKNTIFNTGSFTWADGRSGLFGDVALGVRHGKVDGPGEERALRRSEASLVLEADRSGPSAAAAAGGSLAPVVLDLDLEGIGLVPIARSKVFFDADNDGVREQIGWVKPGNAILALDLDGDGQITRGEEISFTQYVVGALSDLDGLAAFDTNQNGSLDKGDASFERFLLWTDRNMDGVSQQGELGSLDDRGVAAITLTADLMTHSYGGNTLHRFGTFSFTNGSKGALGDVSLGFLKGEPSAAGQPGGDLAPSESRGVPLRGGLEFVASRPIGVEELRNDAPEGSNRSYADLSSIFAIGVGGAGSGIDEALSRVADEPPAAELGYVNPLTYPHDVMIFV